MSELIRDKSPCRKCGAPVQMRGESGFQKRERRAAKRNSYFFAWWFWCSNCHTMYMDDKAKRWPTRDVRAASFSERRPVKDKDELMAKAHMREM